jgi:hypothetical protein
MAALLAGVAAAVAQPAPFDMTPESELVVAPPPAPAATQTPAATVPEVAPTPEGFERYLLPFEAMRLEGEESREAIAVYLTEAQAQAPARLGVSYLNAIVVAPEISRLVIRVNNTEVSATPIASSANPAMLSIALPAGLLRAGANTVEFIASQRHRTDCSVNSTFELWTEIPAATARLVFTGEDIGRVRQLTDLAAIGVDMTGATTMRLITADVTGPEAFDVALTLAQQLAIALRVPNLRVELANALSTEATAGVIDVVLGPVGDLPAGLSELATQAAAGPLAALVPQSSGANVLVVSGPGWPDVAQAATAILTAGAASPTRPRIDLPYAIPTLSGGMGVSLAELGLPTAEFNGRRHTAHFNFELPSDFYANRYGEAELILDAAYSADVLPGSEIDIYTNTQIASATPLLRTDGGALRDTAIRVPMTSLRPGRNEVDVVVNLSTRSDAACSPGWTGTAPVRFVFSSSSQFRMPDYARAAALPDLRILTGSAWPYSLDMQVPIVVGPGADAAVAAMTFLARIATASARVLPVEAVTESEVVPEQNALFVAPLPAITAPGLARLGVSSGALAGTAPDDAALDQFNNSGNANGLANVASWALERVGLTLDDLRILPQRDAPYPASAGNVVVVQAMQPEGGVWTALTALDDATMLDGMRRLAVTEQWREIGGRVSTLGPAGDMVEVVATRAVTVVPTQPFSLQNFRLVLANWFSGNILAFTALLTLAALVLMGATSLVLGQVGRQK